MRNFSRNRTNAADIGCKSCEKPNSNTHSSFLNSPNRNNELGLKYKIANSDSNGTRKEEGKNEAEQDSKKKKINNKEQGTAMDRRIKISYRKVDRMMLESENMSQLTSRIDKISNSKSAIFPITVADDSKITGTERSMKEVYWKFDDKEGQSKLFNTIFVSNLSTKLLRLRFSSTKMLPSYIDLITQVGSTFKTISLFWVTQRKKKTSYFTLTSITIKIQNSMRIRDQWTGK